MMHHIAKVFRRILSHRTPLPKVRLLWCYTRLLTNAYFSAKLNRSPGPTKIFGYLIHFHNYAELINLFEEIFIYHIYHFKADHDELLNIVDGGSNIGMSVLYFKILYPKSRIICFEPALENFAVLERNVIENAMEGVQLYNLALSGGSRSAIIAKVVDGPTLNWRLFTMAENTESQVIKTVALSELITDKPNHIKLDVEGSELFIIDDLIVSGKIRMVPEMIMECHPQINGEAPESISRQLSEHGFICKTTNDELHPSASEFLLYASRG